MMKKCGLRNQVAKDQSWSSLLTIDNRGESSGDLCEVGKKDSSPLEEKLLLSLHLCHLGKWLRSPWALLG